MHDNDDISAQTEFIWPKEPAAIMIMGKRQGTKKVNKQLYGRIAMATALWYSAPPPKPYIIFVATDISQAVNAAYIVKKTLTQQYHIPSDFVMTRRKSNCTLIEVRLARVLYRVYGLAHIFAVTHLYHAARTQTYFDEVLADEVSVIPVHPDVFDEIVYGPDQVEFFAELRAKVLESLPTRVDNLREMMVEWGLTRLHTVDRRGRLERWLAQWFRPG